MAEAPLDAGERGVPRDLPIQELMLPITVARAAAAVREVITTMARKAGQEVVALCESVGLFFPAAEAQAVETVAGVVCRIVGKQWGEEG